jgi:hypothetical protein
MSFSATKGYLTKPKPGVMLNPLHPLSKGLVGCWLFNEGAGSLVNDISGHGNHSTLANMSPNAQGSGWGGSKFGGGLQFDGSNDYVGCGNDDSLNITDTITIATLIKINERSSFHGIVGDSIHHERSYSLYQRNENNKDFTFRFNDGGVDRHITFGNYIVGNWHYVVGTWDGTTLKGYIDGVNVVGVTGSTSEARNFGGVKIGYISSLSPGYFNASIDSIRIYNRALSAEEVKILSLDPFCNLLQVPIRRYSVAAPPVGAIINQFQRANIGADLYNGAIMA